MDVYEAFLRYDDKPMITNYNAVQESLARFCSEGHFGIASGEADNFARYFFKEQIPYFDVTEDTYWLIDKSQIPAPTADPANAEIPSGAEPAPKPVNESRESGRVESNIPQGSKSFKTITISGKVAPENYSQIFSSFVQPLINNKIEIRIEIKGKATDASPITENTQNYKIAKESANQLGLMFTTED